MIKRQRQEFKIVGLCVIIALFFLCTFNVTYSYFTAVASINGQMDFYNLNVKYGYREKVDGVNNAVEDSTLIVSPNKDVIARGENFELLYDNIAVDYLYFLINANSCDCYIRFTLDAYKVRSNNTLDTSVNYGQYFEIGNKTAVFTKKIVTNSNITKAVYYMNNTLTAGDYGNTYRFCDSITLLNNAPVDMLNGELRLTITFKAVQAANEAYKSVFNDGWGYLDSWK